MKPVTMGMTALALALSGAALSAAWAGEEPAPRAAAPAAPIYYPPTVAAAAPIAIEALPLAVNREAAPRPDAAPAPVATPPAANRIEPAKVEAPKPDAVKAERPKAETPKAGAARTETPRAEAVRAETPKAEMPKAETPRAETPKVEPVRTGSRRTAALVDDSEDGPALRARPATATLSIHRGKRSVTPAVVRRQQFAQQAPPLLPIARCTGLCGRFILIGVGF